MAGGFFLWNVFCYTMPKMGLPFFPFYSCFFFPKIKQTESKMVWHANRPWATTIEGFRYLVIMSNFKCGEIKGNIDLVHNNVVTSLVVWCLNRAFDRLWAFRILFLKIRTGFSSWKKNVLKAEIQLDKIKLLNSFLI